MSFNFPSKRKDNSDRTVEEKWVSGAKLTSIVREAFDKKKLIRFRAFGWSMFPFIQNGDVITLLPKRFGTIRKGNVAAYICPFSGNMVIHRVLGRTGEGYLFKGDRGYRSDPVIPEKNVLGKVIRVERDGRRLHFGLGNEGRIIALLSRWNLIGFGLKMISKLRGTPSRKSRTL